MPRLKYKKKGKRVNIWIPHAQLKTASQIENLSKFFQICIDTAPDIMTWAMLHDINPKVYPKTTKTMTKELVDEYNDKYPLDELTLKRQGKWPRNSQNKPELW